MEGADVFRRYMFEGEDEEDMTEEETMALQRFRLEQNSEYFALDELTFGNWSPDAYLPHDDDWARDGAAIGTNNHLKRLIFEPGCEVPEESYEKFFRGVAKNRSIEALCFDRNFDSGGGKTFQILEKFFAKNEKFRKLIVNDTIDDPTTIRYIISTLEKSKGSTIEHLQLTNTGFFWDEDYDWGDSGVSLRKAPLINKFFSSLSGFPSLIHLDLSNNAIQTIATTALAVFLGHPSCAVKHLNVSECGIDDECVELLVEALAGEKSKVEELIVHCLRGVKATGWKAFSTLLEATHTKIKTFDCGMTSGGTIISNSLASSSNTTLKKLDFSYCFLRDETVIGLVDWMTRNNSMVDLRIGNFGIQGFTALASYLSSPSCVLTRLELGCRDIELDCQVIFTDALKQNKSLVYLNLNNPPFNKWQWGRFVKVLCDVSSFDATYRSNHTLQKIKLGPYEYDKYNGNVDVQLNLAINRLSRSEHEAARLKIYDTHLKGGDINMQPFEIMSLGVMPYALSYLGDSGSPTRRSVGSPKTLLLLYSVIRGMAAFIDLGNAVKAAAHNKMGLRKRKRNSKKLCGAYHEGLDTHT